MTKKREESETLHENEVACSSSFARTRCIIMKERAVFHPKVHETDASRVSAVRLIAATSEIR